jgi:hypothetical protein
MSTARYRSDYDGEFILLDTKLVDGKKIQEREWIDNPLEIDHRSPRAVVIGSDVDRLQFDYKLLEDHVGGLRGCLSLQTYGVGELWKDMKFNYLVASSDTVVEQIASSNYSEDTVVYASAGQCIKHPGMFYIVPHQPLLAPIATAVYLAAFDGYQEVYLLGFNSETPINNPSWINDVDAVINTYQGTKFIFVGVPSIVPSQWRHRKNVRTMRYPEFVTHCDV